MGEVELNKSAGEFIIRSVICCYGDAALPEIAEQIGKDISLHWNEPGAIISIGSTEYSVKFEIEGRYTPDLKPETVWYNDDPSMNFFRIEEFVMGNISFVDGLGCNTGYFKLDNLLQTSTTAAHEYGHTLGLSHPKNLDIRGSGQPGIMYPRGTICDPHFQYIAEAKPASAGGTLNPAYRKVTMEDILALRLHKIFFNEKLRGKIGEFSSIFHEKHTAPAV